MQDLSLHILDILENSARAGARHISLEVTADLTRNRLTIRVEDDGSGMDEETLHMAESPFYTSKAERTKKVGLGIPLFKQSAEHCDGGMTITSQPGKGTVVQATFAYDHIDRMPMGHLADTVFSAVLGHPAIDHRVLLTRIGFGGKQVFRFDTAEIREELGDEVPLTYPDVVEFIGQTLQEGVRETKMEEM